MIAFRWVCMGLFPLSFSFCPVPHVHFQTTQITPNTLRALDSRLFSSDNGDTSPSISDDAFMKSLRDRMTEVVDKETKLPLVVADTMLPRQILSMESDSELFVNLINELKYSDFGPPPTFAMIGIQRSVVPGVQPTFMKNGVEVTVLEKPTFSSSGKTVTVRLQGGRRFRIAGELANHPGGWTESRVEFLDSTLQEQIEENGSNPLDLAIAMSLARNLTSIPHESNRTQNYVEEWLSLARQNQRSEGQINTLLEELGEMPDDESPSECAFWIGALINPLPALGVAMEIRPGLLLATTARERMEIALEGIQRSISHMNGSRRMW